MKTKKMLRLSIKGGGIHEALVKDWESSIPVKQGVHPSPDLPPGTVVLGLGGKEKRVIAIRTDENGDLYLEFEV